MDTLKISGKDYELRVTVGLLEKALGKARQGEENNVKNLLMFIWTYLVRRWYGLKPFVFKFRLKNKISLLELKKADELIAKLTSMEDREGGN